MSALPRPSPRALLKGLRGRPDSEHEMSFNRVALGSGILVYALAIDAPLVNVLVLIGYTLAAIVVLARIAFDARKRPGRRFGAIVLDVCALGHLMHANGAMGSAFYPLYLWLILGNGFRFGVHYLWAAVAASLASFGLVLLTTPFWRALPVLSTGLMLGLVALPGYAGTLIRKLSAATAAAEEASRAKSYFLASVSHELRTPLTAILGLGAHLAETERDAESRAMAGTIVSAGQQLLALINRLLDFSRYEAKGGEAEMRPFDLAALLVSVRELMAHQAQTKGLSINLHLAADTPLALIGDEAHLRDILINLVGNALKFTEEGAITIVARMERRDGANRLRLEVVDTGIGIAEEAQGHIFGSFRQADDTIIDRYGGTGLGLAICKQLVALMGGEIGVESRPGEGSRFWFTARVGIDAQPPAAAGAVRLLLYSDDPALAAAIGRGVLRRETREEVRALYDKAVPTVLLVDAGLMARQGYTAEHLAHFGDTLARGAVPVLLATDGDVLPCDAAIERTFVLRLPRPPAADALDAALATAVALSGHDAARGGAPSVSAPVTPRRILVADDNAMNQKVFGMILGKAGHDVTTADDGESALDLMRERTFDVVLMDVNMPVLNGVEATKLYRFASLGQPRVPILAITADASPATAQRCLEAGMDACISKPVEPVRLLDLIATLTADAVPPCVVPGFDPAGVVTPLFAAADGDPSPAIDGRSLAELEDLGGRAFLEELLDVYTLDAASLLGALDDAVAAGDVEAFRTNAHALRSSAANVGAMRVAEMCLHYQRVTEPEFRQRGAAHRDRLRGELARVADALAAWRTASGPRGSAAA